MSLKATVAQKVCGPARLLGAAALVAAVLAASGCARSPVLLLVLDPFAETAMTSQGWSPRRIEAELRGLGGGRVEVLSLAPEDVEQGRSGEAGALALGAGKLRLLLGRFSPLGVYLSPMLASAGLSVAPEYPQIVFFLDGPLPAGGTGRVKNLRVLRYDLLRGYAEAAAGLGELLSMPELPPALRSVVSEARGRVVAVVSANPDKSAQRELELFRETLSNGPAGIETEYRVLDSLEDRARARRAIERLREEGVGIFLLRATTLNGFCLEVLQKAGGLAIAESEAGIEAYADALLLTLERDFAAALGAMASAVASGSAGGEAEGGAAGRGATGQGGGALAAAGSVQVPVRLHWWAVSPEGSERDE